MARKVVQHYLPDDYNDLTASVCARLGFAAADVASIDLQPHAAMVVVYDKDPQTGQRVVEHDDIVATEHRFKISPA